MPRPLFTPGKEPAIIAHEAGWAPGPVCTGAENLAPTGILSPDRPARSQSLYRLSYPAHSSNSNNTKTVLLLKQHSALSRRLSSTVRTMESLVQNPLGTITYACVFFNPTYVSKNTK
jgi:hypothetical protein